MQTIIIYRLCMMSRVLVVGDDIQLCELLGEVLENEGYHVDTVHCGESALEFIQSHPADLVLLDVMLPNLSGIQVARLNLPKRFANSPYMLTALNDDASMLDGYQAGADQYIAKPFNVPELLTRIKVILRRVGFERQRQSLASSNHGLCEQLSVYR